MTKLYVSKSNPYQEQYKYVVTKFEKDGIEAMLVIEDQEVVTRINPNKAPRSWAVGQTIDRINNAMKAMNHRLYRGDVYINQRSPRAFLEFSSEATGIDAGYFKEGIENSFPDKYTRIAFLKKIYQCLCVGKMPQKCRKLVVEGPRDSGKTTWASVFLAIIPLRFVVSITREKQFSASMLNDDTQIVLLDEWAEDTLESDMAKIVFTGWIYGVGCQAL